MTSRFVAMLAMGAMALAATAQALSEPPASCATSYVPREIWDDRIEIAATPDSVELTWNAPELSLEYWAPSAEENNTWVLWLPTVPALVSSCTVQDVDSAFQEVFV